MRALLSIVFMSVCCVAFAQTDLMSIKFSPSFIKGAQLTVSKGDGGYSMSLKGDVVNESVNIKESSLSKINDFMPEYFIGKQNEDSVEMAKQINGVKLLHLDGITVAGTYNIQQTKKMFEFWSPKKDSVNFKLMALVFNLMKASFVKPETTKYISDLSGYFQL